MLGLEVLACSLKSGAGWFDRRWGHLELLLFSEFVVLFSLSSVLSFGVSFSPCSALLLFILVLIILMLCVMFPGFLEGRMSDKPFELTFDGDLLTIIERMVHQRGVQSVKVSKVKGHADDDMDAIDWVRVEDRVGNDLADRAAGFGSLT